MQYDFRLAREMQEENRDRFRLLKRMGIMTPEIEAEYRAIDEAIEQGIADAHLARKRKIAVRPDSYSVVHLFNFNVSIIPSAGEAGKAEVRNA